MQDGPDSYMNQRRRAIRDGDAAVPVRYADLKAEAAATLPREDFDYVAGGAGTEDTVRANRAAFRRARIVPRALRDVTDRDLSVDLFGATVAAPLVLAPVGGQLTYDDDGELATARAAASTRVPMALSTVANHSIESVASAGGDTPQVFQLYWPRNHDVARSLIERADAAGYGAIVLTVDSKLSKWRVRNLRNAYERSGPSSRAIFTSDPVVQDLAKAAGRPVEAFVSESAAVEDDPAITWDDLETLQEWTDLPVYLKGILSAADARRAVEAGVEGVVVSNHGGRQIDGEVGAFTQLPAVVDAVDGRATVVLDSGVRTGADAFKALALGADAVQVGRPFVFGLAVAGERGVREVVLNLLAELESIVGLAGYSEVADVDREAITWVPGRPGTQSSPGVAPAQGPYGDDQ